jgi:hypothetical protein
MDYRLKYYKYKAKYMKLKMTMHGGIGNPNLNSKQIPRTPASSGNHPITPPIEPHPIAPPPIRRTERTRTSENRAKLDTIKRALPFDHFPPPPPPPIA